MKLAASNIGWGPDNDQAVFEKLRAEGFAGVEIAPTRLVPAQPYAPDGVRLATSIAAQIRSTWGLDLCSMQSVWYGLSERIFGSEEERAFLLRYTRSAIDFAAEVGVPHIVFGCPKNRVIDHAEQYPIGVRFFSDCAAYAEQKGVVIGMEANPALYGTNYLNTTPEALALVRLIDSPSFRLNLDVGTIIANQESIASAAAAIPYASHVQISEPALVKIVNRSEHAELARLLKSEGYEGWVSLEMKNLGLADLFDSLEVVAQAFGKN